MMKRGFVVALLATVLLVTMVAPASATKPDPGTDLLDGHKITICHATRSLSNPYVEITIDIAAWNDPSDDKNHGDHHTRTKDGVTWKDYVLQEGEECGIPDEPTCDDADFIVRFSGEQLVSYVGSQPNLTETVSASIPKGTYSLILVSTDAMQRLVDQSNEQWRAVFSDGSTSAYTPDLIPEGLPIPTVSSPGGTVTFSERVRSVTAEHWDVENVSLTHDSVVPVAVCLIGESEL